MVASVLLVFALLFQPYPTIVVQYDYETYVSPDVSRITSLARELVDYIELRCECDSRAETLQWDIFIVPFVEFEAAMRARWPSDNLPAADGISFKDVGDKTVTTMYYQWPTDELVVHELLHIFYPRQEEANINYQVGEFFHSDQYKEWAREQK